jgi:hypothetical protein
MGRSVHEIAYEVSLEAIRQQHQALTNLRARGATVVAGAALVASFLGPDALEDDIADGFLAVGLVGLVLVLFAASVVLWPYGFRFRLSARTLLDEHAAVSPPTDSNAFYAFLAATLEDHHDANERVMHRLHQALQVALMGLGVETLSLLAAIACS